VSAGTIECPWCGVRCDDATDPTDDEARPKAGAVGVCLYCSGLVLFVNDRLAKRRATKAEVDELSRDPRVIRYVLATQQLMIRGKK